MCPLKSVENEPYQPGFKQEWTQFSFLRGFLAHHEWKSTLILLYTVFATTLWVYLPQAPRLLVFPEDIQTATVTILQSPVENGEMLTFSERLFALVMNSQQIWGAFFLFGVIPALIVKFVFRENLSDYGLSLGLWSRTRNLILMVFPLVVVSMYFSGKSAVYLGTYPYNPWILGGYSTMQDGWAFMTIYFAMYAIFYYLSWEFFFRGFIQIGTESTVGCFNAVLIGTLISTAVHFGPHPMSETLGAIVGGIAWGFFVYRTRSIFASWVMHASLGIFLDFFLLYHFLP